MRVVFLEDVSGVAQGGDVKEVKNGFARNYLIPKNLAVPATHNALQRVTRLAEQADTNRIKLLADMRELAEALEGTQVQVDMRSGANGQLYGSVTNAIIAEKLAELTEREIDRRTIEIAEPIRELGTFDVNIRLHSEVQAQISVLVYPTGTDPNAVEEEEEAQAAESEGDEATAEATQEAAIAEVESEESEEDTSDEETEATEDESEEAEESEEDASDEETEDESEERS